MKILGISAYYHDSAAALIEDGRIVAAAQEERFTRRKHDPAFPSNAIQFCLGEGSTTLRAIDRIAFYDKPLLKFERLLETYLSNVPRGFRSFLISMPVWLKDKLYLKATLRKEFATLCGVEERKLAPLLFAEHHQAHAASAFFPSPFERAGILCLDGVGEWATASFGVGRGNKIQLSHELRFPHSLGLLYSAFTYFTGFKVNSGEYKLMGLAPYGQPKYRDLILEKLIDLKADGSFRLNMDYFGYCHALTMTNSRFERLFGGPPRKPESPLTQREMDLAASIQAVTEEAMLRTTRHIHSLTRMKNLVLAGGVALNCVANGRILRETPFEGFWIQPAAGDAGGALGAALFVWHQLLDKPRTADGRDSQRASLLGPAHPDDQIRRFLTERGARFHAYSEEQELISKVAELIDQGKVIGWFQGRMEFGPRALGNRSIIGDARSQDMQSTMNKKIKFRESFRPFAPCVLRENVADYFEMRANQDSPYMLLVAPVRADKRLDSLPTSLTGLDKLKARRSVVPAITHVDYSARVQTVDPERHPRLHRLMTAFKQRTGCPVIINTSFNIRGEPIVCSPEDAYRCFLATNMDVLVLENQILYKHEQPQAKKHEVDEYKAQFSLD